MENNNLPEPELRPKPTLNKLILFGNGGSASDAQHIATELVVKYKKKRKSVPAIS